MQGRSIVVAGLDTFVSDDGSVTEIDMRLVNTSVDVSSPSREYTYKWLSSSNTVLYAFRSSLNLADGIYVLMLTGKAKGSVMSTTIPVGTIDRVAPYIDIKTYTSTTSLITLVYNVYDIDNLSNFSVAATVTLIDTNTIIETKTIPNSGTYTISVDPDKTYNVKLVATDVLGNSSEWDGSIRTPAAPVPTIVKSVVSDLHSIKVTATADSTTGNPVDITAELYVAIA